MELERALEVLELLPYQRERATIRAAFRRLASVHHPDHGGDAATFATLREAYDVALEGATDEPLVISCGRCDGSGHITIVRGFYQATQRCPRCAGTGRLQSP
jgi:DnaJ-class molecular chaperone